MRRGIISTAVVLIALGFAGKAALAGSINSVTEYPDPDNGDILSDGLSFDLTHLVFSGTDVVGGNFTVTNNANYTVYINITSSTTAEGTLDVSGAFTSGSGSGSYHSDQLLTFDLLSFSSTVADGSPEVYALFQSPSDPNTHIVTNAFFSGTMADTSASAAGTTVPTPASLAGGSTLLALMGAGTLRRRCKR